MQHISLLKWFLRPSAQKSITAGKVNLGQIDNNDNNATLRANETFSDDKGIRHVH